MTHCCNEFYDEYVKCRNIDLRFIEPIGEYSFILYYYLILLTSYCASLYC